MIGENQPLQAGLGVQQACCEHNPAYTHTQEGMHQWDEREEERVISNGGSLQAARERDKPRQSEKACLELELVGIQRREKQEREVR